MSRRVETHENDALQFCPWQKQDCIYHRLRACSVTLAWWEEHKSNGVIFSDPNEPVFNPSIQR